jgi:hypothetical protein
MHVALAPQLAEQAPPVHTSPGAHAWPQAPQF